MKLIVLAVMMVAVCASTPARAGTIIEDWTSVTPPPAPDLKPVTITAASTALLLLDFNGRDAATSGPCNRATKPRCLASVPKVGDLLAKARAKGVVVVYSLSGNGVPTDIQPAIAPAPGDPIVKSGPDKFIGTDLGDLLAKRGIATVVVTGTAAEGAVLDTATHAALHGIDVVVPVDGMSSTELYAEQYVTWHLAHAPGVSQKTTLTRLDQIGF